MFCKTPSLILQCCSLSSKIIQWLRSPSPSSYLHKHLQSTQEGSLGHCCSPFPEHILPPWVSVLCICDLQNCCQLSELLKKSKVLSLENMPNWWVWAP